MSALTKRVSSLLYRGVLQRTSTFVLSVMVGAVIFERAFDSLSDEIWYSTNRGKLWKDIRNDVVKKDI